MDTVALVDRYPGEDERVIAREIVRGGGGPAAVAAVTLSRQGIQTAIIGTIGDDSDGKEVLRIFEKEGVDTRGISIGNSPTAGSVIVASLEHGSRAINTRQPAKQAPINGAAKELVKDVDWIHADHVGINLLPELGIERGQKTQISFDAGYDVGDFDASTVDLFVPTDKQMAIRYPKMDLSKALESDSIKARNTVVATQGSSGSSGYSLDTGFVSAKGYKVEVKSTLGAGDVFHGALVASLIQGFPLQMAMQRSNAVAALSCRGLDGQSAIPTKSELDTFMKELDK